MDDGDEKILSKVTHYIFLNSLNSRLDDSFRKLLNVYNNVQFFSERERAARKTSRDSSKHFQACLRLAKILKNSVKLFMNLADVIMSRFQACLRLAKTIQNTVRLFMNIADVIVSSGRDQVFSQVSMHV